MKKEDPTYHTPIANLNDRERQILRLVVRSFVDTAGPVGSRFLSKRYALGLSPASIRNTMSDLEEQGFLAHPYTSSGRVPTDRGYRAFVDGLMEWAPMTRIERRALRAQLDQLGDTAEMLRVSSRLLGELTSLLGVVLSPRLATGVLERLDVVPLSSSRLMFVLSVRGGLLRTIIFHVEAELNRRELEEVVRLLNERLAGLTLEEIRRTCEPRVRDLRNDRTGLIQLVLEESALLFNEGTENRLQVGGTPHLVVQPEFQDPEELRQMMELIEDEGALVNLLEDPTEAPGAARARVRIGQENAGEKGESAQVARCSIVTARYQMGDTWGTIGVIGPKRMDYARVMALVEGMAALLDRPPEDDLPN